MFCQRVEHAEVAESCRPALRTMQLLKDFKRPAKHKRSHIFHKTDTINGSHQQTAAGRGIKSLFAEKIFFSPYTGLRCGQHIPFAKIKRGLIIPVNSQHITRSAFQTDIIQSGLAMSGIAGNKA